LSFSMVKILLIERTEKERPVEPMICYLGDCTNKVRHPLRMQPQLSCKGMRTTTKP
jgi:hypothetical protein